MTPARQITTVELIDKEPTFIFLAFDITRSLHENNPRIGGIIDWFDGFCTQISENTNVKSSVSHSLNGLAILLNKCDLITYEDFNTRKEIIQRVIREKAEQKLQRSLGVGREDMEFFFCCLLEGCQMPLGNGTPSSLAKQ
jgi:hypothetical protein